MYYVANTAARQFRPTMRSRPRRNFRIHPYQRGMLQSSASGRGRSSFNNNESLNYGEYPPRGRARGARPFRGRNQDFSTHRRM
jgi:hypothetical protein